MSSSRNLLFFILLVFFCKSVNASTKKEDDDDSIIDDLAFVIDCFNLIAFIFAEGLDAAFLRFCGVCICAFVLVALGWFLYCLGLYDPHRRETKAEKIVWWGIRMNALDENCKKLRA